MQKAPTESAKSFSQADRKTSSSVLTRITRSSLSLSLRPGQWLARRLHLAKLSRKRLGVSAALLLVSATGLAIRQYARPFEWHAPYALFRIQWWLHPVEWNVDSGLPQIEGNINAVVATPDSDCLWIAGDAALLAFSTDQGRSWTQLVYDPGTGNFRAPANTKRCGAARAGSASLDWLSLTPTVYAASEQSSPQQVQRSIPAQTSPEQSQRIAGQGKDLNPQISPKFPSRGINAQAPSRTKPPGTSTAGNTPAEAGTPSAGSSPATTQTPPDFTQRPNLWGMTEFGRSMGPTGASMFGSHAEIYYTQDLGLTWSRQNSGANATEYVTDVSDKRLNFTRDPATNTYRLRSVGGYSAISDSSALQWNSGHLFAYAQGQPGYEQRYDSKPPGDVTSMSMIDPQFGWAINFSAESLDNQDATSQATSQILHTNDAARNWTAAISFPGERLKSVDFLRDGKHGWVAGDNGVLLGTEDGGGHWQPLTAAGALLLRQGKWTGHRDPDPYVRFVAPWYLVALLICGVLATPVLFPIDETDAANAEMEAQTKIDDPKSGLSSDHPPRATVAGAHEADASTIGNQAIADKPLEPGDPDALGLATIAAGLAFFLRNEKTKPPLAIAINGRWGSGKTSLMNLLKSNLETVGAHPVWFNAWHHQKEDQMLAALLQAVKSQAVPPLWQVSGLTFRGKLAGRRLQRSWYNLVLLAGAVFLIYETGLFISTMFGLGVIALVNGVFSGTPVKLPGTPVVAILTAAGAIYKVISSGLTAFGTNPSSLLASVSGGTNIKDLDAQTSFRQRFATEFNDVTRSLGQNQRMLILIDDLDRCRPEKVREVLEGVNFLACSGDCFIVLGMARDIVEHCVGLSFAPVVDTMSWEAMGLTPRDIERAREEAREAEERRATSQAPIESASTRNSSTLEIRAKRHAFAHLYLDKLIQIEVSVPEPTALQRQLLFRSEEEIKKDSNPHEQHVQSVVDRSREVYEALQPLTVAALAALVLFGVWTLARTTIRNRLNELLSPVATNSAAPARPSIPSGTPTSAAANPMAAPASQPRAGVFPYGSDSERTRPPVVKKVDANLWSMGWAAGWPFYLVGLGTGSLIASSLRRLPQRIVRDEAPFTNALAVWHPLVMTGGAKNTPRTARRFQNKVRYLAMRQRALLRGKAMSLGERWLRQLLGVPLPQPDSPVHLPEKTDIAQDLAVDADGVRQLVEAGRGGQCGAWTVTVSTDSVKLSATHDVGMDGDQFRALVLGNVYIPEPVLVALTAIEEYAPDWIRDGDQFRTRMAQPQLISGEPKADMFARTLEEHSQHWDNWHNLEQYRRAYLRLCSEVSRHLEQTLA